MNHLIGVIYEPPYIKLPTLAVIIEPTGEVVRVRTAPSRDLAEAFLAEMKRELTAETKDS